MAHGWVSSTALLSLQAANGGGAGGGREGGLVLLLLLHMPSNRIPGICVAPWLPACCSQGWGKSWQLITISNAHISHPAAASRAPATVPGRFPALQGGLHTGGCSLLSRMAAACLIALKAQQMAEWLQDVLLQH